MAAISARGLTRHYGDVVAAQDVTFDVEPGEVFGFMGHNGAGKTTTLKMLLGLTRPTRGTGTILGHDVVTHSLDVRRVCGFLPASYALPPDMSARQFLVYVAAMFDLPADISHARAQQLLDRFGLAHAADRKLRGFSTGMLQKVGLAQALVNEPRVVLLDEPTAGLDPLGRHELLELLGALAREHQVTVMFSSHILSDVAALCRRVAVMHRARVIACGELQALQEEHHARTTDDLYLNLVRREAA